MLIYTYTYIYICVDMCIPHIYMHIYMCRYVYIYNLGSQHVSTHSHVHQISKVLRAASTGWNLEKPVQAITCLSILRLQM